MNYKLLPIDKEVFGILCLDCGVVLVSWYGHDYKTCSCPNSAMADGGQSSGYNRYGAKYMTRIQLVTVSPIKKIKPKRSKKK